MTRFDEYRLRQQSLHGDRFTPPTDQRLIDAYNNGDRYRVKVRTTYGSESFERWGFVSLTCGWAPAFLLMRRRGQYGSSDIIGSSDEIIAHHWI